mgnify:CR=1 FL=1
MYADARKRDPVLWKTDEKNPGSDGANPDYPLAITGMNLADTIMSGHAGTAELAGVAIGANIWMPIFTGLNGILQALTPIVANYRGAKAYEKISGAVFSGLMLALILSVSIISVGILQLDKVLSLMNLESSVEVVSHNYLSYVPWALYPYLEPVSCALLSIPWGIRSSPCGFFFLPCRSTAS